MLETDALNLIRETLSTPTKPLVTYLFGSRSKGTSQPGSDYDLLVVVAGTNSVRDRISLSTQWRGKLAKGGLDADILVKSPEEVAEYRDRIGSIVHEALETGIAL